MTEPDPPEPPDEAPWEVNDYAFEPPGWFEFLFAGSPLIYPPMILVLLYLLWGWVSG